MISIIPYDTDLVRKGKTRCPGCDLYFDVNQYSAIVKRQPTLFRAKYTCIGVLCPQCLFELYNAIAVKLNLDGGNHYASGN